MSKKTIIITWRFIKHNGHNFYDPVSISSDYEIIKFYTPDDRDEPIDNTLFSKLISIISEIGSDLFVFIHTPNFKRYIDDLLTLNKPEQNIHIIPFYGGTDYVYKKLINQNCKELKDIDADSIVKIFKEIEEKYGRLSIFKSKLNLLHKCLSPEKLKTITESDLEKLTEVEKSGFEIFKSKVNSISDPFDEKYVSTLSGLRTTFLSPK